MKMKHLNDLSSGAVTLLSMSLLLLLALLASCSTVDRLTQQERGLSITERSGVILLRYDEPGRVRTYSFAHGRSVKSDTVKN